MTTENTYKFEVNPMTCQSCYRSVNTLLDSIEAVSKHTIDLSKKTVEVKTTLSSDEIINKMKGIGKEAVLVN
ncbi:24122_t:CDS:2 [Cetraspora pellucida]|uniref:24122_t:CDS:1 n=1 Tax=Cetraspora pellucida TaxID=1433469 RepID=A0A9N9FA12_9GLOM|nr:24122_t:CDS:2 [Cetraspora pellucida]